MANVARPPTPSAGSPCPFFTVRVDRRRLGGSCQSAVGNGKSASIRRPHSTAAPSRLTPVSRESRIVASGRIGHPLKAQAVS